MSTKSFLATIAGILAGSIALAFIIAGESGCMEEKSGEDSLVRVTVACEGVEPRVYIVPSRANPHVTQYGMLVFRTPDGIVRTNCPTLAEPVPNSGPAISGGKTEKEANVKQGAHSAQENKQLPEIADGKIVIINNNGNRCEKTNDDSLFLEYGEQCGKGGVR